MHPIALPVAELKPALTGLAKVINPRATLPVLRHIKVERTPEGWTTLTATDLDRFVTVRLEHPAEGKPCAALIPHEQLVPITRNGTRDEHILIELTPEGPLLKFPLSDKLGESTVPPIPVAKFPQTPRLKAEAFPLPPEVRRCLHEAMECVSTDTSRQVLQGTFVDVSAPKAQCLVATDGRHLYSANSFALPLKRSLIIPSHRFLAWREFNLDGEWQMKADDTLVQISSRRWRFIARQIQGTYPDWRVPIPHPRDARTHVAMDPAQLDPLIPLIERLPCHDERFRSLGLQWHEGCLFLLAKANNTDPWLRVPVSGSKGEGPDQTVFLDRRFLLKALRFGLNAIDLIDDLAPMRFHREGKQLTVMPVRPDAAHSQPPMDRHPAAAQAGSPPPPPSTPTPQPKPMITHPIPDNPAPNGSKSPIEQAIERSIELRDRFRDGATQLHDLSLKLKAIQREQKLNAREFHSVRSTLRSLQGLKL